MLGKEKLVAFGATVDAERAARFYTESLGLRLISQDEFAVALDANGVELRLQCVERLTLQPFTSLGWQVTNVDAVVAELASRGVVFQRYAGMEQSALGVWQAPSGARIAWFKDPDGNVLSVAEYPAAR